MHSRIGKLLKYPKNLSLISFNPLSLPLDRLTHQKSFMTDLKNSSDPYSKQSTKNQFSNHVKTRHLVGLVTATVAGSLFYKSLQKEKSPVVDAQQFDVHQKSNSIYYELRNPSELKGIEIGENLYWARFYFSINRTAQENLSHEAIEEIERIKGVVSSAVYPPSPEIGYVSGHTTSIGPSIEIYAMKHYQAMSSDSITEIKKTLCIAEQLHPLEWILTKARNSGILSDALYDRTRIDVRNRMTQLQQLSKADYHTYHQMVREIEAGYLPSMAPKFYFDDPFGGTLRLSHASLLTSKIRAMTPPFSSVASTTIDWTRESENKDKSVPPRPDNVYLINGGDEQSRKEKAHSLTKNSFGMYAIYHNKDKSECAVVLAYDHDTFNLMNFERAKKLAGQNQLSDDTFPMWHKDNRFGVITLSDSPKCSFRR